MFALRALGVLVALAVTLVQAQTATSTVTSTTSSSSGAATVTIAVGAEGMVFTPSQATANVGDTIRFNFYPGGHRVARAAFGWPCIPYQYVLGNLNKPGFNTGEFDPQVVSDNPPHFDLRVNDTDPIFFYCYAPGSCVDYHMIGVINQNATETYDAQLAFAQNVTYQLGPGDPFPSETPLPKTTTIGAPPGPTSASSSSSGGSSGGGGGGGGGLSNGAIAGIAIGVAALLVITAALIYLCGRRGGFDKAYRKSALAPGTNAAAVEASPALGMSEIRYANGGEGVGGCAKSPGHVSSVAGFDGSTLRSSGGVGGGGGGVWPSPGQGTMNGYGLGFAAGQHGYGGHFPSPHSSPPPPSDQHTAPFNIPPPPVELPSGDAPAPTQSPPPGYRGRDSWAPGQEGQYRPSQQP